MVKRKIIDIDDEIEKRRKTVPVRRSRRIAEQKETFEERCRIKEKEERLKKLREKKDRYDHWFTGNGARNYSNWRGKYYTRPDGDDSYLDIPQSEDDDIIDDSEQTDYISDSEHEYYPEMEADSDDDVTDDEVTDNEVTDDDVYVVNSQSSDSDVIFVKSTSRLEESADAESADENINMDDIYEVEDILQSRKISGTRYYYVKWMGYDEHTWEPESNISKDTLRFFNMD